MNRITITRTLPAFLTISTILVTLVACGRPKIETCKFVEIEDAELEIEFGDVDAERGEVEMVCGDDIIDVTWGQFRQKLRIDPGRYKNNLEAFKRQVTCLKEERSRSLVVFCSRPGVNDDFVALNFSYDD